MFLIANKFIIKIEEIEDLNAVITHMSNERLLSIEASAISRLQELVESGAGGWGNSIKHYRSMEAALLYSLRATPERGPRVIVWSSHITINARAKDHNQHNAIRILCLCASSAPASSATARAAHTRHFRPPHKNSIPLRIVNTHLLYAIAVMIENTLFHGVEWLTYALSIGHPATGHQMLCSFWWLGIKVIHAFQKWILVAAALRAGTRCSS